MDLKTLLIGTAQLDEPINSAQQGSQANLKTGLAHETDLENDRKPGIYRNQLSFLQARQGNLGTGLVHARLIRPI